MPDSTKQTTTTSATDVFLFIPNLIGYFRVACTLGSFVLMITLQEQTWVLAICLYVSSFVGDLFDGMAARKFNQCSVFGGLLDMVTDRCSTLGLLYVLGMLQPTRSLMYLMLILLDISSHWCQMYSSMGSHHKSAESNANRNFLVRWYYQHYWFFGYLCVGAEFTYIASYILHYLEEGNSARWLAEAFLNLCLPGCVMKQFVNVSQLCSACHAVAEQDAAKRQESQTAAAGSNGGNKKAS